MPSNIQIAYVIAVYSPSGRRVSAYDVRQAPKGGDPFEGKRVDRFKCGARPAALALRDARNLRDELNASAGLSHDHIFTGCRGDRKEV